MNDFSPDKTYLLQMPCIEAWPYAEYVSNSGIRYYQLREECITPTYDKAFWQNTPADMHVLCWFFRGAGCHIMPSGSGVTLSSQEQRDMWNFIKVEERKIQKGHIQVIQRMDGQKFDISDPSYKCQWPTFSQFAKEALVSLSTNRLYVLVPENSFLSVEQIKEKVQKIENSVFESIYSCVMDEKLTAASEDGSIKNFALFCLEVSAQSEEARQKAWFEITKSLAALLSEACNGFEVPEYVRRDPDALLVSSSSKGRLY